MCARNGCIQAHGFCGRPGGRFRPVRGAIDEGDIGRYEGEPWKAFSAGIRGKESSETEPNLMLVNFKQYIVACSWKYASIQASAFPDNPEVSLSLHLPKKFSHFIHIKYGKHYTDRN